MNRKKIVPITQILHNNPLLLSKCYTKKKKQMRPFALCLYVYINIMQMAAMQRPYVYTSLIELES